uniref:Uncharacterized protein n=1 Tax=Romanomermis culicivorax TaxID=13658 RepID=A0A915JEA2_ROMCU
MITIFKIPTVGNRPYSASLLTILQSLSLLDLDCVASDVVTTTEPDSDNFSFRGGSMGYQQWDLIEQFIAAVCSMDSSQKDLPEFLNYLQQILTNLLCKSVKNVETQTSHLDDILENVHDRENNQEFKSGEQERKKRRGFKKKLSNFWNFTGKNSTAAAAEESPKKLSSKKKRVNYKLKSGSNNARRLNSSKKLKAHLYLPYPTERNKTEFNQRNVTERKEIFVSFGSVGIYRRSIVFQKITLILSDRKWIFRLKVSNCWRSVPYRERQE